MADKAIRTTDVLILGGGLTGVSAAMELSAAHVDFQLLEASSERLGGRVQTFSYRQGPPGSQVVNFEHGAQYIGASQTEIFALAQQHLPHAIIDGYAARLPFRDQVTVLGGKRYCYDRDDCLFGIGGIPPELDPWNVIATLLLIQEIEEIERTINVAEPWASPPEIAALDGMTMAEWFNRPWIPTVARDLVILSVQALLSVEPSEISAFYFFWYVACNGGFLNVVNDEKGGPQQYYLATGVGALIDKMAEPFRERVHLGCPVDWIEQRTRPTGKTFVKVTCQDGTVWEADKVIVAMSPNTAGRINYDPPVPPKRRELMDQSMGRTIKCQVCYDTPWWRDSNGRRYTGYAGAVSSPVLWAMDNSPLEPANRSCFALMTFTVGRFADAAGPLPSRDALAREVTEALAFLFDDTRALSTSKHFVDFLAYTWNPAETFVGGGPNTVLKPGMLTGDDCAGRLLNEPWNDVIFFASAETVKKLCPSVPSPSYVPSPDPAVPGTFSDHRQSLGYMDGAIISGRYVAAQVRGLVPAAVNTPPPSVEAAPVSTPILVPDDLSPAQVHAALALLCEAFYAGCALQIPAWEAPPVPWQRDPVALQAWLAEVLVGALVQAGLLPPPPVPPTPAWLDAFTRAAIAFVGAGYRYWKADIGAAPPADQAIIKSIQELTAIAGALMQLKSIEPFTVPPEAPPSSKAAPSGRFTSLLSNVGGIQGIYRANA